MERTASKGLYLRIFLLLMIACFKACALISLVIVPIVIFFFTDLYILEAIIPTLLTAFLSGLFGSVIALPALIVGTALCKKLIERPNVKSHHFIVLGTLLATAYGAVVQLITDADFIHVFASAGFLSGSFWWRDFNLSMQKSAEAMKKIGNE